MYTHNFNNFNSHAVAADGLMYKDDIQGLIYRISILGGGDRRGFTFGWPLGQTAFLGKVLGSSSSVYSQESLQQISLKGSHKSWGSKFKIIISEC